METASAGKLVASIGKVVPLDEAVSALTDLEQDGTPKGKLVIVSGLQK